MARAHPILIQHELCHDREDSAHKRALTGFPLLHTFFMQPFAVCQDMHRLAVPARFAPWIPDGFVANFAQEVMPGQGPCLWRGLGSQGVEQFGRSAVFVSGLAYHLSFLDHVHEFHTS